jgi:NADPH-dependent 7-cyano-7-deazaguanine reductase QueF-like protein
MSLLKKIFGQKEKEIHSDNEFWNWFISNQQTFFNAVKNQSTIHADFFELLSPKLDEIQEDIYYVSGMYDDDTAELILTADGNLKNFAIIEQLVNDAPTLSNWKFTALKPALNIEDVSISLNGINIIEEDLFFYANSLEDYPDEIDLTFVHKKLNEENENDYVTGIHLFLENFLGEISFASDIDNFQIIGLEDAQDDLIPIKKLKDYLNWRQKEFIEKYDEVRYNTDEDEYTILEAELKSGNISIACLNSNLLFWEAQVSHPWIAIFTIKYDGSNHNGLPKLEKTVKLTT